MCIYELSVLAVVLHSSAHAAPHGLVGRRVVAIVARTCRREVNISAMFGMLRRQDMVERSQFVVVGKTCLGIAAVQVLGEFQHVVGVACLRTVDVVDEVGACLTAGEVLAATVPAEGKRALAGHDVPEILACRVVCLVAAQFGNALESHHLRHLSVGVHVVEAVLPLRHRREQTAVRESFCHVKILLFLGDGIGIGQHLVHAAMLVAQHLLHLSIAETCREVDGPVAETEEQPAGLFVAAVEPCVAQSRVHLMKIVEWCPRAEVHSEVALLES